MLKEITPWLGYLIAFVICCHGFTYIPSGILIGGIGLMVCLVLLLTFTALIGIIILAVVIFKFVPIKQRLTFMAAGLVGGVTGFVL